MTQTQLQEFASERGLVCMGPTIAGTWNGYPFMSTLRAGRIDVLNTSFTYLKGPAAKQLRQARKQMPRGCALSWTENKVVMVCSAHSDQIFSLFQAGMDAVTALLRECGTTLSGACALCKQGGCDGFALANNGYVPVHQACCENASHDKTSRAVMNNLNGSYVTGWIGALLGGLVGALPTIFSTVVLEIISGWLCALIPLGAYYGYKLFKGKMDRTATAAAIVSSLLQVFIMEQIIFYIAIVQYMGLWPSPFASVAYYFQIMDPSDMAIDMLQPLIFVALGIFIVFGIIKRTSQNDIQEAGVMIDSLTDLSGKPIPRAQPVQQPVNAWAQPAQSAQWGQQPAQWAQPQQTQWGQPQQSAPQQPVQPQWEPATAARPLVSDPARTSTRPIQPQQPVQTIPQPVQPPVQQSAQWAQPGQTMWNSAPVTAPVQPAQPEQPAAPAAEPGPAVQTPPVIQPVEPLSTQLPDLPDLPEVPSVSTLEEKPED